MKPPTTLGAPADNPVEGDSDVQLPCRNLHIARILIELLTNDLYKTAGQGQYCPTAGDDPYCWEGAYDYYSNGCIKVSRAGYPSDLRLVHDGWHGKSADYRHGYFTINNWLYVRNG